MPVTRAANFKVRLPQCSGPISVQLHFPSINLSNPLFVLLLVGLAYYNAADAAVPVGQVRASPDVQLNLAGLQVPDQALVEISTGGVTGLIDLGPLPAAADLSAYHLLENGEQLFVLDIATELSGALLVRPNDIVRRTVGGSYVLELNGNSAGIPHYAKIDALTLGNDGAFLVSFNISVTWDGIVSDDEDLVSWDGANAALFFDGSAEGIPTGQDLDAAHLIPDSQRLLISLDGTTLLGGSLAADEDLLEFNLDTEVWTLAFDSSLVHADWLAADLDAVYATLVAELLFSDGFEGPTP